jgi:hypothetical protein
MTSNENWLPVVGFEDLYEVSDQGRVRSLDRVVIASAGRWGRPLEQRRKGRILRLSPMNSSGHLRVVLRHPDGSGGPRSVHVLVAEAFIGPRPEGLLALHQDDDTSNNRATNIYWGTRVQNAQDAIRNGRHRNARKIVCDRGHELAGANLLEQRGKRRCRACNRAWHALNRLGALTPEAMQAEADRKYRAIMNA